MKEKRRQELIVWHLDQLDKLLEDNEKNYSTPKSSGFSLPDFMTEIPHSSCPDKQNIMHFDEIVTIIISKLHKGECPQ